MRFFALFCLLAVAHGLGCIDGSGNSVDWWVALKVPYIPGNSTGYEYAYADSNNELALASDDLTSSTNAIARTLSQVYSLDSSSSAWLFYNDESPDGSKYENYGHFKGNVAFNREQGFWLVHSVPRFPPSTSGTYSFPEDEKENGQSFLCLSFSTSTFNDVGYQFLYDKPHVYDSNLPDSLMGSVPNLQAVLSQNWTDDTTSIISLHTKGGQLFTSFAKSAAWNDELYENLVAPKLDSNLNTETWQNGRGPLPSWCTPQYTYDVQNIAQLQLGSFVYPSTKDHSKWAITTSKSGYTCIGDINRMQAQFTRGGGTLCFYNAAIYNAFNNIIFSVSTC